MLLPSSMLQMCPLSIQVMVDVLCVCYNIMGERYWYVVATPIILVCCVPPGRAASVLPWGSGHSVVRAVPLPQPRAGPHPGVITPMSAVPRGGGDSEQRFLTVTLSGECHVQFPR